jgi:16S rRNA (guanine527-N7)-methyltransferase
MNVLLEYGLPLLETGGRMLLWKGRNYQQEIEEAQNALNLLGGVVEDVWLYTLMEERDRAIVVVRKDKPTPKNYPRRVGIPAKRPL